MDEAILFISIVIFYSRDNLYEEAGLYLIYHRQSLRGWTKLSYLSIAIFYLRVT